MAHEAVVSVIQEGQSLLGESPWWDGSVLSWTDILANRIHSAGLDGSNHTEVETPSAPGFALPIAGENWLVGLADGLAIRDHTGQWSEVWKSPLPTDTHRVNDGKPDRQGRVWFGLMSHEEKHPTSALYRWSREGVTRVRSDIITSNGIGWSPDGTIMYHTDSIRRVIRSYDYDEATGHATNERVFTTDPTAYVPDGLTVDVDGCVWGAKWDGHQIVRYRPDGLVDRKILLPVSRPTSCIFVGGDLKLLAVTTATTPDPHLRSELDGKTLLIDPGAQGYQLSPAKVWPSESPDD